MKLICFGKDIEIHLDKIEGYSGFYEHQESTITISIDEQEKFQTLLHELFHAMYFRTGLIQTKINYDLQEVLAENISVVLCENWNTLCRIREKFKKENLR